MLMLKRRMMILIGKARNASGGRRFWHFFALIIVYKLLRNWRLISGFTEAFAAYIYSLCKRRRFPLYHRQFTFSNGEVSNNYWLSKCEGSLANKRLLVYLPGGYSDGRTFVFNNAALALRSEFDDFVIYHNPGFGTVGRFKNLPCVPPVGYHIPEELALPPKATFKTKIQ